MLKNKLLPNYFHKKKKIKKQLHSSPDDRPQSVSKKTSLIINVCRLYDLPAIIIIVLLLSAREL